jgi:hypothetical protein
MPAPEWMKKHPCLNCGEGYGICSQGAIHSLMCCDFCSHPSRWEPNPWTSAEYIAMWNGKEMPPMVQGSLRQIIERESKSPESHGL